METLLATYAVAWAAVAAYVVWLAAGNVRLAGRLDRLESLVSNQDTNKSPRAKVA